MSTLLTARLNRPMGHRLQTPLWAKWGVGYAMGEPAIYCHTSPYMVVAIHYDTSPYPAMGNASPAQPAMPYVAICCHTLHYVHRDVWCFGGSVDNFTGFYIQMAPPLHEICEVCLARLLLRARALAYRMVGFVIWITVWCKLLATPASGF